MSSLPLSIGFVSPALGMPLPPGHEGASPIAVEVSLYDMVATAPFASFRRGGAVRETTSGMTEETSSSGVGARPRSIGVRRSFGVSLEVVSLVVLVIVWQVAGDDLPVAAVPHAHRGRHAEMWDAHDQRQAAGRPGQDADAGRHLPSSSRWSLGTAIGIAFGRVRALDRLFSTWVVVGLNLPAIVIAIVLYIWLGLTEFALILAVMLNKLPLVIATIREGVRSFSRDYDELGRAPSACRSWRRLRLISVPQLMPFVLAAARTGLSLIWKIVLVFEVLGSDGGVGFRISVFFQFFDITGIFAYTTAFILVVLVFEYLVLRPLEGRVLRWRRGPALRHRHRRQALRRLACGRCSSDFDLDVAPSSVVALVGPSGRRQIDACCA